MKSLTISCKAHLFFNKVELLTMRHATAIRCHFLIGMRLAKRDILIQDGAENADVQQKSVPQKVILEWHRNPS